MIRIDEIINDAEKAIRANFHTLNLQVFVGMPERQTRLVMERKRQIREWVAVVRILRDPANHGPVLARVTDRGEHSGRNQNEMALFCAHLPESGLSETQRQILLNGLAQQYAHFETWAGFVGACVENPNWVPSRGPVA